MQIKLPVLAVTVVHRHGPRQRVPQPTGLRQNMKAIGTIVWIGVITLGAAQPTRVAAAPSSVPAKEKVEKVLVVSRDPATVSLGNLFREADVVALITVLAGDAENYANVVYKASVVQAFKGAHEHDVIYFGPFRSYSIGSEYVVALKATSKTLGDLGTQASGSVVPFRPEAPYLRVMYEGYSVMAVSYTCQIPACDWAIEVSDEQVLLPNRLATVPSGCHNGASSFVWVRKRDFLSELSRQREGK